jgi:hypothetical protein
MGRILFSIFLSLGIISGSAFGSTSPATAPAHLKPEAVAVLTMPPSPDPTTINTSFHPAPDPPVVPGSVTNQAEKTDSGWHYLGTLLATLVLIGAIAVRRHTAGNP